MINSEHPTSNAQRPIKPPSSLNVGRCKLSVGRLLNSIDVKFILFLALPLYALDQLTKQLVLRLITPYEARIIVPDFFSLVNVTNTGAAFGSFRGNNTFFVVISVIALVVVTVLLVRRSQHNPWRDLSLALLLAGILGNLTDRLLYGHVIDFLLFDLHIRFANPWPAFNVADSCISIAVVLFIIHSFRRQSAGKAAPL
jgi:signal peptidase II